MSYFKTRSHGVLGSGLRADEGVFDAPGPVRAFFVGVPVKIK